MAVKAKRTKAFPLEPGSYVVKIQDVSEVNSDYGDQAEITFKVQEGDYKGEKFSQRFSLVVSEKSYLGAMIQAVDDVILDQEEYDIEQYEGKMVGVVVGESSRSKTGAVRITGFYPPGKPGRKDKEETGKDKENDIPI